MEDGRQVGRRETVRQGDRKMGKGIREKGDKGTGRRVTWSQET